MKVLKIGAIWCSGCLVMRPRWQKIEKENTWIESEYFEYDDSPEIIEKYNLKDVEIPVVIFLDKDGNELERLHGEQSEKNLVELLNKYRHS